MSPGRLLPLGDAYTIEPGRLQFLTAPAAPLIVTLRGDSSCGYVERWPVRIDLDVGAWAPGATAASNLLSRALAARLGTIDRSAALVGGGREPRRRTHRPSARSSSASTRSVPMAA